MRNFLLLLAPLLCLGGTAQWELQDPLTNPGFVHFYNNEFDAAIADFKKEVAARPDDCEAYNHLAQGILYRELFRNGALESQLVSEMRPDDDERPVNGYGHNQNNGHSHFEAVAFPPDGLN